MMPSFFFYYYGDYNMIKIHVNSIETFDESTSTFSSLAGGIFRFEHSLRAISKWEEKWCIRLIPNLNNLTAEQLSDYFCCMCMDDGFSKAYLSTDLIDILTSYINDSHTATTFHSQKNTSSNGRKPNYSSEEIYARMVLANIPFECDEWNIERLFTLLNAVSILSGPKKRMKSRDVTEMYNRINEKNLKKYNSRG